jgi:sec-independent protein translocase protein TatB
MLEVGWSELLVIAIILIVVVGPKDLPAMMRTFGRVMGRVRTMANEFRGQFDEAMREAELDDVRKGLGEVNKYNPTNTIRDAMNPIRQFGQDIKADLEKASSIPTVTRADEGTPVAELSSDPAVDPEPLQSEPATVEPAPVAASKPQPTAAATAPAVAPAAVATAPAVVPAPVVSAPIVAEPVAAAPHKPVQGKTGAEAGSDYPPAARKVVKRKAPEPHVDHNVHVVAQAAKPAAKPPRKAAAKPDVTADAAPKAKRAPRTKTAKTSDA